MNSIEAVKARVEQILELSPAGRAVAAVDVLAEEDHDGEPYLRVNLHLPSSSPKLLDDLTPQFGTLATDIRLALSDIDGRYPVIRFPEDG